MKTLLAAKIERERLGKLSKCLKRGNNRKSTKIHRFKKADVSIMDKYGINHGLNRVNDAYITGAELVRLFKK